MLARERHRQEGLWYDVKCEVWQFMVILSYIMSFRLAWATWDWIKTVTGKKLTTKNKWQSKTDCLARIQSEDIPAKNHGWGHTCLFYLSIAHWTHSLMKATLGIHHWASYILSSSTNCSLSPPASLDTGIINQYWHRHHHQLHFI